MEFAANRDEFFMRMAIKEAREALNRGEVPVGAVVVAGDAVIGRGHNLVETLTDATAHAEMQAITAASSALGGKYLNECTLYVTVEPCVMCAGAMAWAQLGRLVYGAGDPKRGFSLYGRRDGNEGDKTLLHPRTEVVSGVLEDECSAIVTEFFRKLRA
jgi:tRNA(adenine34) deaminase